MQPVKENKIGPLKLHTINFCPKFGRSPILKKIIDSERKTLSDWYKLNYKINYEPIQSVYLQYDGVTRDEKINFNKLPTFHYGFFFFFPGKSWFPSEDLIQKRKSWFPSEDLIQVPLPSLWIRNVSNFKGILHQCWLF